MVSEQPLLPGNLVSGIVVRVGAQTGFRLDDVAVETDQSNYALFQVKAGMSLGSAPDSPLAEALQQAVDQYLHGLLPAPDRAGRPVDPQRDALVICTDHTAPASVRVDLRKAVARAGRQPPGTALGFELSKSQMQALEVALRHVRRLWSTGDADPTDDELRRFLRALRILTVDANDGEADHSAAITTLRGVLPVPSDATKAWPVLVEEGQAASDAREWRDRAEIGVALARRDVLLSPAAKYTRDVVKLKDLSVANLHTLHSQSVLPVTGGVFIRREVSEQLAATAVDTNFLIVGDAGAGKSAVLQDFASTRSRSQDVVALRATDVAGTNRLMLDAPIATVLRAWPGAPGLLVIDGVDALRGAEDREFLNGTVAGLQGSRWQIVATVRTFDARNNRKLQQTFSGAPLLDDPAQVDTQLAGVRHLLVGDFTDAELDSAPMDHITLGPLMADLHPGLRALLRNPFNLRLAAELTQERSLTQQSEFLAVRTHIGLLEEYWRLRIHSQDGTARNALLARLCSEMARSRSLRVLESEPLVTPIDNPALEALLSENVLAADGLRAVHTRRVLSFSHNILFDYAAAVYLLVNPLDRAHLIKALDADPTLPLIARPSFEILVDLLWEEREEGSFWPICLGLAKSPHVLASLAFAGRVLNLIQCDGDLAPLAPGPAGRADLLEDEGSPRRVFVHQLIGALRAPTVLADPVPAVGPLAVLARDLAANAGNSARDAALAADLLIALQARVPLHSGDPSTDHRGEALAGLLDACRAKPEVTEQLAGAAARQLQYTVRESAAARDAVERLIDDQEALSLWGGTVLSGLAMAVAPTISENPDLARRMAATVVRYEESREAQVSFLGSALLQLNESRRQQADFATYLLGRAFDQICAASLSVAVDVYCDLAQDDSPPQPSDYWPISVIGANGWLQYGRDLATNLHGADENAARALSAALATADSNELAPALLVLVERLHNAAAWAAIMSLADHAGALGRAFLPVFESGALLVHPDTHFSAARLLAALASEDQTVTSRLETAVLRARDIAGRNDIPQQNIDNLIRCLAPGTVRSSVLASRLTELGLEGSSESPPRALPAVPQRDEPLQQERPQQLEPSLESAAKGLHTAVNRWHDPSLLIHVE